MLRPLGLSLCLLAAAGCSGVPTQRILREQDLRAASSQQLIRASRSWKAGQRLAAVRAMGRIQSPAYVDALGARLRDWDRRVRLEAVFALGQLGLAEPPQWPEARATLASARETAASRLRALLTARWEPLRARVYEALGKTGGVVDEPALAAGLRDRDPGVRGQAALALFRLRMRGAIPDFSTASVRALRVAFSDPDAEVRWRAVYPFSRYAEPRLSDPLAEECGTDESDHRARLFACRALGLIGKAAPWQEPEETLQEGDPQLRFEAVRSLGLEARAEYLSEGVYSDDTAHVRAAVADALAASDDKKKAYQLDAVDEGGSVMVRAAVTAAYAKLKPREQALRRIAQDQKDPRWWVRSRAYDALAEVAESSAAFRPGLDDPDPRVRAAALEALGARPQEARAAVAQVLASTAPALEVAGTAVELAKKLPDPLWLVSLRALYESPLARRYPELAGDAAEAYDAIVSTLSLPAPKLTVLPAQPKAPSPWLGVRLPPTFVVMKTAKGELEIALATREAPIHAAAFADSVRKGVYDGLTWHRVVSGFVVQGGDPLGSGWGDCGFSLRDEVNMLPFDRGVVGMPKAGKDTGGCQLFITLVPTPHLDGRYTVFGRVTRGMDVVDRLEPGDRIEKAWISQPKPAGR